MPGRVVEYVHRIGRTGRMGRLGHALTIMEEPDLVHARDLVDCLKEVGQAQGSFPWLQRAIRSSHYYRNLRPQSCQPPLAQLVPHHSLWRSLWVITWMVVATKSSPCRRRSQQSHGLV